MGIKILANIILIIKMVELIERITAHDNMLWAWQKARKAFSIGDIWFCNYQLSKFEANLDYELKSIIQDIRNGKYKLELLHISPFPKGFDNDKNQSRARQAFYVSVRDQVTWLAVCNVIAADFDQKMPAWSYGNRIYRPAWYEFNDEKELIIGNYRNSNGHIYRKWKQSWPLFRKHITATLKIMSNPKINDYITLENREEDIETIKVIEENDKLEANQQLVYLSKGYFNNEKTDEIYWASLDLEKFYPNLNCKIIKNTLLNYESSRSRKNDLFSNLINSLFDFKIDYSQWNKKEIQALDLSQDIEYKGLPTGLLVAGFLANVALLKVDKEVNKSLDNNNNIAHFRFVDDHVILSTDFDDLVSWIKDYIRLLEGSGTGAKISEDKIEPKNLTDIFFGEIKQDNELYNKAKKSCKLDPQYPSPLMTQTLAKVSAISKMDLDLMSNSELEQLTSDLKHLLITDFPDQEVKKETRISFAATMLSKTAMRKQYDYNGIYIQKMNLYHLKKKIIEEKKSNSYKDLLPIINYVITENIRLDKVNEHIQFLEKKDRENYYIGTVYKALDRIINIFKAIESEKNQSDSQVYNLIKKAIKENHQKVRLWIRLVEFCHSQGYNKYSDIWVLIESLSSEKKAHKLSVAFLYYMYVALIIELLWKSLRVVLDKSSISSEIDRQMKFIEYICSEDFLSIVFQKEDIDKRDNYKSIFIQFKVLIGTIPYILNSPNRKEHFDKFHVINWDNNPEEWIISQKLNDINIWLFWLLNNTHNFECETPHSFWPRILSFAKIDVIESVKPLIMPFTNAKGIEGISNKNSDFKVLLPQIIDSNGWLFEYYQTIKNVEDKKIILEQLKDNNHNLFNNINKTDKATLYDWILFLQKRQFKIDDLRFSEWTSLCFILSIIRTIKHQRKDKKMTLTEILKNDFKQTTVLMHPSNFYLPNDLFESFPNTWQNLEFRMKDLNIEVRPEEEQIKDNRYDINISNSILRNDDSAILYGLAILMIQLFCRKTTFPWIWNLSDRTLIWTRVITKNLMNNAISSFSQFIIQSCLSARNRETMILTSQSVEVKDTNNDPPIIFSIDDLEQEIEKVLRYLKSNQISVENNSPRQLIPISLIQLSNNNNPFNIKADE